MFYQKNKSAITRTKRKEEGGNNVPLVRNGDVKRRNVRSSFNASSEHIKRERGEIPFLVPDEG